jgi:hypothetical protein
LDAFSARYERKMVYSLPSPPPMVRDSINKRVKLIIIKVFKVGAFIEQLIPSLGVSPDCSGSNAARLRVSLLVIPRHPERVRYLERDTHMRRKYNTFNFVYKD